MFLFSYDRTDNIISCLKIIEKLYFPDLNISNYLFEYNKHKKKNGRELSDFEIHRLLLLFFFMTFFSHFVQNCSRFFGKFCFLNFRVINLKLHYKYMKICHIIHICLKWKILIISH